MENWQILSVLSNSKYNAITYWRKSRQARANWRSQWIAGIRFCPIALCPISCIPSNDRVPIHSSRSLFAIIFATVALNYSSHKSPVSLIARTYFVLVTTHAGDIIVLVKRKLQSSADAICLNRLKILNISDALVRLQWKRIIRNLLAQLTGLMTSKLFPSRLLPIFSNGNSRVYVRTGRAVFAFWGKRNMAWREWFE